MWDMIIYNGPLDKPLPSLSCDNSVLKKLSNVHSPLGEIACTGVEVLADDDGFSFLSFVHIHIF